MGGAGAHLHDGRISPAELDKEALAGTDVTPVEAAGADRTRPHSPAGCRPPGWPGASPRRAETRGPTPAKHTPQVSARTRSAEPGVSLRRGWWEGVSNQHALQFRHAPECAKRTATRDQRTAGANEEGGPPARPATSPHLHQEKPSSPTEALGPHLKSQKSEGSVS